MTFANLGNANLEFADFSKADAYMANFENVNANHSQFRDSFLVGVELSGGSFRMADFSRANLTTARLVNSNFSYVNFEQAFFNETDVAGADLSNARFFDTHVDIINHHLATWSNAKYCGLNTSFPEGMDPVSYQMIDICETKSVSPIGGSLLLRNPISGQYFHESFVPRDR